MGGRFTFRWTSEASSATPCPRIVSSSMRFIRSARALPVADGWGDEAALLPDPPLDDIGRFAVLLEELLRVLTALADAFPFEGVPSPAFLVDSELGPDVDELPLLGDTGAVEDVELGLAEGWRHLVFHHFDLGSAADDLVALLDGRDAPDVEPNRGVELEGVAAGGGFGVAEHHTNLHANLVDED